MVYRAIGIWNDQNSIKIGYAEFLENAGNWSFELKAESDLPAGTILSGIIINDFIDKNNLQFKVALISIHVNNQHKEINGGSIAALTSLPVITDLPSLDLALGGNGEFTGYAATKLQITEDPLSDIFKAVCVAFIGILRWREEYNFLSSNTGASRNNIGGALWMGQEA